VASDDATNHSANTVDGYDIDASDDATNHAVSTNTT
jgi:hypothetical protein